MPRNHISLILYYMGQLRDLAMVQHWIDGAREAAPNNTIVQKALDDRQMATILRKTEIENLMFDISSSN